MVDGLTGAPIEGAELTVTPLKGDGAPFKMGTGADGRFLIADVPEGKWVCWARKSGCYARLRERGAFPAGAAAQDVAALAEAGAG